MQTPQALITASLLAAQDCRAELFHTLAPESRAAEGSTVPLQQVTKTIRDQVTRQTVAVVVNAPLTVTGVCPTTPVAPDDVFVAACMGGDAASVRFLLGKIWQALDETPPWQPVCLVVFYSPKSPTATDVASQGRFITALRELDEKLNRQSRYYGCSHIRLDDNVTVPEEYLKALPQNNSASQSLTLGDALQMWIDLVKAPTHVIFDRKAQMLTVAGQRALRRAFWLLDRDVDGLLSDAETLLWQTKMFSTVSEDAASGIKSFLRNSQSSLSPFLSEDGKINIDGFIAVNFAMLRDGNSHLVWALLADTGIQREGVPYTADQLRVPAAGGDMSIQLSLAGVQFFSNLYSKRRFARIADMWDFVPDYPWNHLVGLPSPHHRDLSQEEFIDCWRVMAALNPTTVAEFAFYWGYNSHASLLFVTKPLREARLTERDWPTTLRVAVFGSTQCGKSSLLYSLSSEKECDASLDRDSIADITAGRETIHVVTTPRNGVDTTLILQEIPEAAAAAAAHDDEFIRQLDGVLLCFSRSDADSVEWMLDLAETLADAPRLVITLVMTKSDLDQFADDLGEEEIASRLAAKAGLPFCPFITSTATDPTQLVEPNDIDSLVVTLTEALHCFEATRLPRVPFSRKLRRAVIVAIAVALLGLGIKKLLRRKDAT